MPLSFTSFTEAHIAPAAALLAARYQRICPGGADFGSPLADADTAQRLLTEVFRTPWAVGIAAMRDGRLVGYLLATPRPVIPVGIPAMVVQPRSLQVTYPGYALAADEDPALLHDLYAAVSPGLVDAGFLAHYAIVPAGDAATLRAWQDLSFGIGLRVMLRPILPLPAAGADADLMVRRATGDDIVAVTALVERLWRYHAGPPMFLPYLPEAIATIGPFLADQIAQPGTGYFLAYRGAEAVGVICCETSAPPPMQPLLPPQTLYLADGFILPAERGRGVGTALLAHALRWAHDEGYAQCVLAVIAGNVQGARFWAGAGFREDGYRLERTIDDRRAWARPG